jgi:moderate conductance mechanosensitive channel
MDIIYKFVSHMILLYGVSVFWIIVLYTLGRVSIRIVVGQVARVARKAGDLTAEARVATLSHVVGTVGKVVLYVIILFMFFDLFGVDIKPLLASAGIVGFAVGFGSQSVVKDVVSGFLLLVEDRYGIGDVVRIGSVEGVVKKITLRSTVLEDKDGSEHFITNGSVTNSATISRGSGGEGSV